MSAGSRLSLGRLGRDTAIYAIGTVLARVASFVMLPVYTRLLTPADYGVLQMLDLTLEIAGIVLSAGTVLGVMRFYYKEEDQGRRNSLVSTATLLLVGLNLLGSILIALAAPLIWLHVLDGTGSVSLVYIAALNFTLGSLPVVPLLLLQIEQRAMPVLLASTGKLVLQLGLNILFLVGFGWGVTGILLSTLTANLLLGSLLCVWMIQRTGIHPSLEAARRLQRFGIPHQFGAAAMFILAFGDRFFLQASRGMGEVGIYGLAYQFGFLLSSLGSTSFLQAWIPQRFQIVGLERAERDRRYNEGLFYLSLALVTLFVGISLFARPLLMVMSAPAFQAAADIIPVVVVCYLIQGWTAAAHFGIDVSEQSKYSAYANWIAAGVILLAYALLIPRFGGMGAAVATLVGFLARFALVHFWATRLWPVDYHWTRNWLLLALGGAVVVASLPFRSLALLPLVSLDALLCLVYAAAAWTLFLDRAMKDALLRRAAALLARVRPSLAAGPVAPAS